MVFWTSCGTGVSTPALKLASIGEQLRGCAANRRGSLAIWPAFSSSRKANAHRRVADRRADAALRRPQADAAGQRAIVGQDDVAFGPFAERDLGRRDQVRQGVASDRGECSCHGANIIPYGRCC
jgi:hypothetical protein